MLLIIPFSFACIFLYLQEIIGCGDGEVGNGLLVLPCIIVRRHLDKIFWDVNLDQQFLHSGRIFLLSSILYHLDLVEVFVGSDALQGISLSSRESAWPMAMSAAETVPAATWHPKPKGPRLTRAANPVVVRIFVVNVVVCFDIIGSTSRGSQ